ncbi:MAG TPA: methyltransferase domain-containing protein [Lentibacillus sp.]|uniref:class I SAM-dependent methyltransferase n=1 Tax=Lentibacillus sp. TaxID=1925746 RepID=UPI002B4B90F9|nr:methyltransferase domain-containing protein [Lentibacillus sp.]HLR61040.1 methyltransferase domain-containing protein [Lentibacillus sp.]
MKRLDFQLWNGCEEMQKEKLIGKYDKHVKVYEGICNNRLLDRWRRPLLANAHGNVLEVGVGIGANFPYYDRKNVHVTGVDFSPEMIKSARRNASDYQIDAELLQKDVADLAFEPGSFDCIVSTLTMCGYPNPTAVLDQFNHWCRKGGTILLMEHGISSNPVLSFAQKMADPLFKKAAGCHCDRDIMKIVEDSGLNIDYKNSYWSDIIRLIWARPMN